MAINPRYKPIQTLKQFKNRGSSLSSVGKSKPAFIKMIKKRFPKANKIKVRVGRKASKKRLGLYHAKFQTK